MACIEPKAPTDALTKGVFFLVSKSLARTQTRQNPPPPRMHRQPLRAHYGNVGGRENKITGKEN